MLGALGMMGASRSIHNKIRNTLPQTKTAPPPTSRWSLDLPSGADRDRTGDPLLAKPLWKVPEFYKLLNLRAVLGIGVVGSGALRGPLS